MELNSLDEHWQLACNFVQGTKLYFWCWQPGKMRVSCLHRNGEIVDFLARTGQLLHCLRTRIHEPDRWLGKCGTRWWVMQSVKPRPPGHEGKCL